MSEPELEPLGRARRAIACGSALWRDGLVPEAHAYMASALRASLYRWLPGERPVPEQESGSLEEQALEALERGGYRHLDRLREALAATVGITTAAPATTEVKPAFEWIWAEADRLFRFTTRHRRSPQVRRRARLRAGVGLGVALLVAVLVMVRLWGGPRITVSAVLSPEYPAPYAMDGVESTEWLLPDHTVGWLQITFRSPRRVRGVQLINIHNRHYMDRASQLIRVTAMSGTSKVASAEGRFPGIKSTRSALNLPLDAQRITHLRVEVASYFGSGGGLAEVEVR